MRGGERHSEVFKDHCMNLKLGDTKRQQRWRGSKKNLMLGEVTFQVTGEQWRGTIQRAVEKAEVESSRKV